MVLDTRGRMVATAIIATVITLLSRGVPQAQAGAQGPLAADVLVSKAVKTAKAEHKVVLIEFGASWCVWCRHFDAFVHSTEVKSIIAANYVIVNLTVQERDDKKALENPGGEDLMNTWGGKEAGLPFYVFLNAAGVKIADSNGMPDGTNIGFPASPQEIQAFVRIIDRTALRLPPSARTKVIDYLTKAAAPTPAAK